MKLFSDKVEYRFRQPLSNLQLSKANLYISQYLVYSGLTLIANYGDRFEFRSGFFSGTQTALFRFDRGVILSAWSYTFTTRAWVSLYLSSL